MTTKELAVSVLASLSERKMREFIELFADENLIARIETEALLEDPDTKYYSSFEEFQAEMEEEMKREEAEQKHNI